MTDPPPEPTFSEYAQTRTVTGSQPVRSREDLRARTEACGAWGWTLAEFQERAGVRVAGDTAYVTRFYWAPEAGAAPGETLETIWAEVQRAGPDPATGPD